MPDEPDNGAIAVAEPSDGIQSPASDADNAAPSVLTEEAPPASEEPAESPPEVTQPPTQAELQAKIDGGEPLSSAEKEHYRRYEQSERDRQSARQQARQRAEQAEAQIQHNRNQFKADVEELASLIDTTTETGQELLSLRLNARADQLLQDVGPLVMHGHSESLRGAIAQLTGNQELAEPTLGFDDLLKNWTNAVWSAGRESERTTSEAGKLKDQVADLQKQLKELSGKQAANGSGPSASGAEGVSTRGAMTPDARESMSTSEWLALSQAEKDRRRGWSLT